MFFVPWLAAVLLKGAVVPERLTVVLVSTAEVPQAVAVVPLHGRGNTVASSQAQQHKRK